MNRPHALRAVLLIALLAFLILIWSAVYHLLSIPSDLTVLPTLAASSVSLMNDNLVQGRLMQALYQAEAQAARTGWTPELLTAAGTIWYTSGDPLLAVDYWQAAVQLAPDQVSLVRRLAETLIEVQRWPEAVDALNHLVTLTPDDRWVHYQLGVILAASNPPEATIYLQTAALEGAYQETANALLAVMSPTGDADGAMRVGTELAGRNLWPYAELAFTYAAAAQQSFPEALAYIGLARDRQGKDGGEQIAAALRLAPDNAQVMYLDGLHLRTVGDTVGSLDMLLRAAIIEPENPAFAAETGTAYQLVGDLEQAEAWLKIAVTLSGNNPDFERLLTLFYAEEGFNLNEDTLQQLRDIVDRLPDDPNTLAGYGWALHLLGDDAEALTQLDASLAISPDNPRALYYKGLLWLDSPDEGERRAALDLLKRAAASDGEFGIEAQRILSELGVTP